jgi:CRISPR-associated protein Cmr4
MKSRLYHLHALSALHCGTGQSAGVVDLPIARDRATNLPLVPGSSLRGVLRDDFAGKDEKLEKTLFGPRSIGGADDAHAGALAVGDAHLLLLPIRALAGIVAYATCPFILKRYAADLKATGGSPPEVPKPDETQALHAASNVNGLGGKIVLEDLDLTPRHGAEADADAWAQAIAQTIFPGDAEARQDLTARFLILPDSVFSFLAETATEIRARIAIDDKTGIVKKGALWYEENLPAESVLWGIYALTDSRTTDKAKAAELAATIPAEALLQLGGKAGVGRGLTRFLAGGQA